MNFAKPPVLHGAFRRGNDLFCMVLSVVETTIKNRCFFRRKNVLPPTEGNSHRFRAVTLHVVGKRFAARFPYLQHDVTPNSQIQNLDSAAVMS